VYKYNGSGWDPAWLKNDGTWRDSFGAVSTMTIDSDAAYFIYLAANHPTKTISFVGNISSSSRVINVGNTQTPVGTCYPVASSLDNSGLASSGAAKGVVMGLACQVYSYDSSLDSFVPAWLKSDGTWRDSSGILSTMQLTPGQGYLIYVPSAAADLHGHIQSHIK